MEPQEVPLLQDLRNDLKKVEREEGKQREGSKKPAAPMKNQKIISRDHKLHLIWERQDL